MPLPGAGRRAGTGAGLPPPPARAARPSARAPAGRGDAPGPAARGHVEACSGARTVSGHWDERCSAKADFVLTGTHAAASGGCFVVTLGRVVPLARRAQGCRTPCGAQGSPTGEPAAIHVSGARATGHLLQAGCVNALGGWGECVACEPSVCEHGQCVHVSLCAREHVCEGGCVSGFMPVDEGGEEAGTPGGDLTGELRPVAGCASPGTTQRHLWAPGRILLSGMFRELSTCDLRLWGEWPPPRTGYLRARPSGGPSPQHL